MIIFCLIAVLFVAIKFQELTVLEDTISTVRMFELDRLKLTK